MKDTNIENRLTEQDEYGNWSLKGVKWSDLYAGSVVTRETSDRLYGALAKLHDYEEMELMPDQIENLKHISVDKSHEDVFQEHDRMGLVQALSCLHGIRNCFATCKGSCQEISEAFNVVFDFINDVYLMILEEKKLSDVAKSDIAATRKETKSEDEAE